MRYLHCQFLSYWHPGSGGGLGAELDARVRSQGGLPLLPGRSLKGVLRDACARAEALGWLPALPESAQADGWTDWLFGKPARVGQRGAPGAPSRPGRLRIGSAELDAGTQAAWRALPQGDQRLAIAGMRASLYQTALSEEGVAKEGSLRGIQVYVPMPLIAPLDWLPGSDDADEAERGFAALALCLPLVEGLGGHRTRGLGRVQLSLLTHLPAAAEAQP